MMVIRCDPETTTAADLADAVRWLRRGGVVILPTDTLYGIAVDPTSSAAVRSVFDLKGRAPALPLPLIAASVGQVEAHCGPLGSRGAALAAHFWPGPLSLVLDAPPRIAIAVHAGLGSIAIRVPAHRVARALCEAWGAPLSATSANRHGLRAAARVDELGDLAADARVLVVDAGPVIGGAPSTIVDVRRDVPVLVRAGQIPWSTVLELLHG